MNLGATRVGAQFPEVKDWGIQLLDFGGTIVPDSLRTALLVLLGAVAFVLLIACANIANLLLSRGASRQKEIAVRTALGASRKRMLAQFLSESLLLSAAGGTGGLLAALWTVRLATRSLPEGLLPVPEVGIDSFVLCFALGITLAQDCSLDWRPPGKPPAPISIASSSRAAARPSADSASFCETAWWPGNWRWPPSCWWARDF